MRLPKASQPPYQPLGWSYRYQHVVFIYLSVRSILTILCHNKHQATISDCGDLDARRIQIECYNINSVAVCSRAVTVQFTLLGQLACLVSAGCASWDWQWKIGGPQATASAIASTVSSGLLQSSDEGLDNLKIQTYGIFFVFGPEYTEGLTGINHFSLLVYPQALTLKIICNQIYIYRLCQNI